MKIKKSNTFIFRSFGLFFRPVLRIKYHFKFERKTSKGIKRPCIILFNHQTSFDQFAIAVGFKFAINFVASDSLFRHGLGSFFMKALTRPIPISKGTSDAVAVRNIISVIKQGGAVGLAPSGNRSFFGDECTINPAIGKLCKSLRVPVVLVQLSGGFNTKPRWSNKPSKGKMRAKVVKVIQPDELNQLTDVQINKIINKQLGFDEFDFNESAQIKYRGRHKAEYLESMLFYCPQCKKLHGLKSNGNYFSCEHCGMRVRINAAGFFEKMKHADKTPKTITEWGRMQLGFVKAFDFSQYFDKPVFSDEDILFSSVKRAKKQELIGKGPIALYTDRFSICGQDIPLIEIKEMSIGVNKFNIYTEKDTFAVDAKKNVNLFKYMICGYRMRNNLLNIKEEFYGY